MRYSRFLYAGFIVLILLIGLLNCSCVVSYGVTSNYPSENDYKLLYTYAYEIKWILQNTFKHRYGNLLVREYNAITNATTLINLMRIFIDGPEVSLKGSPTVSPITAAA